METVIKAATHRARPWKGDGKGQFWDSAGKCLERKLSVRARDQFLGAGVHFCAPVSEPHIVPITAYSLAGLVVGARVAAQRHFPGDVVAGAAMGWFIGDYVYGKRHNPDLDEKRPMSHRILDHVRWGRRIRSGPAAVVEQPTMLQ